MNSRIIFSGKTLKNYNFIKNKHAEVPVRLLFMLAFFLGCETAFAGTFSTFRSGKWSDLRTWSNNGTGSLPTANDDVTISGNTSLEIDIADAKCKSITLKSASGSSTLTITGTNKLTVSGDVTVTTPTQNGDAKTITVGNGTLQAANLTLTGSTAQRVGKLLLANGLVKIFGNITFVGDLNAMIDISGTGILRVGGVLGANGTFNAGTASTVIFDGLAPQILPTALTYAHVTIENPTTVTLNGIIPSGKLIGNLKISAGTLENAGFAIAGTSGKTIQVENAGALGLSGTSTFPTGFSNITLAPTSKVIYKGGNQVVAALPYGKLLLSKSSLNVMKNMAGNASVVTALEFNNVKLNAGAHVFTVGPAATISGATSAAYVVVGGGGKLLIRNIGIGGRAEEMLFPVGTSSATYSPAYITNAGPSNSFSVTVSDGVRDRNNNLITSFVVNKTWDVKNETTNNTDNVRLRLQWNSIDEQPGFNRSSCAISHFDTQTGTWSRVGTLAPASGANPFAAIGHEITNFSPFAVGDFNSPLPVELLYFKAAIVEQGALLTWETATEKNNEGFEVQASANGKDFETVGKVATQNGYSSRNQTYRYLDKQGTKTGLWYYRLKQTDLDGTVAFYDTKVVNFNRLPENIKVFPNPFENKLNIALQALPDAPVILTLTDMCGRIVYENKVTATGGSSNLQVDLKDQYPPGLYLLTAKTGRQTYSARLMKE